MAERLIEIGDNPKCPRCGYDQFDDWWHSLSQRPGLLPGGELVCGRCEKRFFIEGRPGNVISSCYGVRASGRRWRGSTTSNLKPSRRRKPNSGSTSPQE